MTATVADEYGDLALDSSNEMLAYDSRRVLGRYPEAAWHMLRAAHGRRRMGILMRDAGQFTRAAEDWLSASACFYLATDPGALRAGIAEVRELDRAGHLPPARRDLHEALRERAAQLESLEERLGAFRTEYARRFGSTRSASPERYAFLRAQVREFPGSADLHFALYRQARELGDTAPAADHLRWAAEFAPDEPEYVGRYGYQLITSGHPDRAAEVARWFLQKHPREASVRVMLAQALASQAGGRTPDRAAALEVLQTVLTDPGADVNVRLAAVTLSGAIRRAAGDEAEAGRLLTQFDQLVTGLVVPMPRPRVAALREIFTGPATGEARDPLWAEPIRSELFRHEDELAATA